MSFQFFSKLDNKLTDGPVSKIDPDRPFKNVAQGGGEMGKAVQRTLPDQKAQKRLARRAYRTAMRSGNISDIARAAARMDAAGGRFMGIGSQERAAEQEMQSRGINVDAAPNRMGQTSAGSMLENKSSPFGTRQQSFTPQTEDPQTYNPFSDPAVPTKNVPFAQREREDFRSDLKKSPLLNDPSVSRADREVAKAQAYKRADLLGIDRAKVDAEMEWDKEKSNESMFASNKADLEKRERLGLDVPPIDPMEISVAQEEASNMKAAGEKSRLEREGRMAEINKGESDRLEKYGNPGQLADRGTAGAAAQKEIDARSASRKALGDEQSKVTDAYFKAAELESPTSSRELGIANFFGAFNVASAYNDTLQGEHSPFIPHGVFSGDLKKQAAGNPEAFKQSIDAGKAFNEALGGKDVKMKYKERGGKKVMTPHGDKEVVFNSDAFTPLKQRILDVAKNPTLNRDADLGVDVGSNTADMDKIVKAAVENNYPIDLDRDLMAIPQFVQRLHTARYKSKLDKNDKGITVYKKDKR